MADEFDPLKQMASKPSEEEYSSLHRSPTHNDDDFLRPPYEGILKAQGNYQKPPPPEQQSQSEVYSRLDFTNSASKSPVRPTNPFAEEVQKSPPATDVIGQLPKGAALVAAATKVYEQRTDPHNKNDQASASSWNQKESHDYHAQDYETGPPPEYYPEEYYEDPSTYKKKGFTATMDRLVQRFPSLSLFYKPSSAGTSEIYETEQREEYVENEGDEAPDLVDADQIARDLTADELALDDRYSNKLRTQIIHLQIKEQTQPVDVCIHHETYTLYACDVGRSVVEIFDMNGKLQHVIDDPTTSKFQPTAIVVASDGTIITASHFNHCLHMYSPIDHQQTEHADQNGSPADIKDGYYFKQYKLGSAGHAIHQFHHPAGINIDFSDGYLYICDRGNFRIQIMRPEGVCERVIELLLQDGEEGHLAPIQIAHQQNGTQLVCIVGTGDAICFISKHADGPTYVEPLYVLDNDGLGLLGANGIAIDAHDRIFISDTGHHRIVICTPDGSYISHFGTEGDGPGQLKRPCGLDITNDGTVVVADSGNKRLQLFGSMREQTLHDKPSTEKVDDVKNLMGDTEKANTSAL